MWVVANKNKQTWNINPAAPLLKIVGMYNIKCTYLLLIEYKNKPLEGLSFLWPVSEHRKYTFGFFKRSRMSELKDYWFLFIYIPICHVLQQDNLSIKKQENTHLKSE